MLVPLLGVLLVLCPACLQAKPPVLPKALRKVGFDQRLNEQLPLNLEFHDEEGRTVQLKQFFGEKPVILTLAYFRCPEALHPSAHGCCEQHAENGVHSRQRF